MGVAAGWDAFADGTMDSSIVDAFANTKAGIDANIWIHQGWAMCKSSSIQEKLRSTALEVVSRATRLVNAGVFPVLVFDGARTESKRETHAMRAGVKGEKFERSYLPHILNEVRNRGFAYVVAPSEADHQLKFLEARGVIDFVMSDDTDAVVLGCRKVVHKVKWKGGKLNCAVLDRNKVLPASDGETPATILKLAVAHGELAIRLWAVTSGCDYRAGKVPGVGPQMALNCIIASIEHAGELSVRSFVRQLVATQVCEVNDVEALISKIQLGLAGYERAVVYDMRTKERCWLDDSTVVSANKEENERLALGLLDSDTLQPVDLVPVQHIFRHGETQARSIPHFLIRGAVLPVEQVEKNKKTDLIRWLNVRRNDRRRGDTDPNRSQEELVAEVMQRMEIERRYEALDIDIAGDVQDPDGKSLHTYLVHHYNIPASQFPELDPNLNAPMDDELWCDDVELFRETSPVMGEDVIITWLAGMSVYNDPVRTKAYRQGYARIHARAVLPIRFAQIGHPWMATHFRLWFRVAIPASLKVTRYSVTVCLLCKHGAIDEETNMHFPSHVVSVERGTCACKAGAGGDFGGCIHVIAALWYFAKLQRPADPCTSLESEWFGARGESDPVNRRVPLNAIDFNRFEVGRTKRRCTVNTRCDRELPEIDDAVRQAWSRQRPSPLLREYFKSYEEGTTVKCTLENVIAACSAPSLP